MKPYGMTADFRIIRPTRVEDKIWEAVEEAFSAGWTPDKFIREVREGWDQANRDKAKEDAASFQRATK